jgi:ATP phosphoribosyltransferase
MTSPLILALPKGRILKEFLPLLEKVGVKPEADFFNEKTRSLQFKTNHPALEIIVVRSFDVATFVAFGAAHLGVAGNDVLLEFDHSEIYAPVDLKIGKCRLSVAEKIETFEGTFKKPFIGMSGEKENFSETQAYSSVRADSETFSDAANRPRKEVFRSALEQDNPDHWSHIRVATKYPNVSRKYFAARGVQAECVKLNGAMELAPSLGLCRRIVDLVSSGATLKANGLVEVAVIAEVTSKLIVNRTAMKTRSAEIETYISKFRELVCV